MPSLTAVRTKASKPRCTAAAGHALWKTEHDADAVRGDRRWKRLAGIFNGLFHAARTQINFNLVDGGACDGEHQGGRIAEIALKLDGAGALGKLIVQGDELEVDVVELLFGVGDGYPPIGRKRWRDPGMVSDLIP